MPCAGPGQSEFWAWSGWWHKRSVRPKIIQEITGHCLRPSALLLHMYPCTIADDLWDITVEVVQFIRVIGQLDHQCNLCDRVDESPTPRGKNQLKAQLVFHDCQEVQRITHGNIPIIGHDYQQKHPSGSQKEPSIPKKRLSCLTLENLLISWEW